MGEPTKEELLFGRIAVHNKLISQEQLDEAVEARKERTDPNADVGRILRDLGHIDEKQYKTIRKAQEKALVQKGIPEEQATWLARGLPADGAAAGKEPPTRAATGRQAAPAEEVPEEDVEEVSAEEVEVQEVAAAEPEPVSTHGGGPAEPKAAKRHKRPNDPKSKQTMLALLKKSREVGASDLHMSCGARPFFRQHGQIKFIEGMSELTPEQGKALAAALVTDDEWNDFMTRLDWDGSVEAPGVGRFRANILQNRKGVSAVYRVIKTEIPTLQQLGLPETLERLTTFTQGLALVTGATGSGKSSTLAALIEIINSTRKDHIITMEDPIEFVFEGKGCNVSQREIHKHTRSWANALRASLREDPDVIMVGEMRDLDTVSLAITASEPGHLVFGPLHTTSATRTIDRLLDVFPPGEQPQIRAMVSESLKGIISQQLLVKKEGKGRVPVLEIMFWTPAVANLIREGTTYKLISVLQTGRKLGMQLMDDHIKDVLQQGLITKEVARAAAANPKLFQ